MMRAIKLIAPIGDDHALNLRLPSDVAAGMAEVIILLPTAEPPAKNPDDFDAFMQWLDCQPRQIRPKEEIDRQIEEERNSWE